MATWTYCEDQLPKRDNYYYGCFFNGRTDVTREVFLDENGNWYLEKEFDGDVTSETVDVYAWMEISPIPSPAPRKENKL